jgi:ABC-type transport system involved in multi-copper enzyme maturation permease subunit
MASVGSAVSDTIKGVELMLALALVPAVTAGAICQEKRRGALALMMATDLSDAEIVLGKLASHLVVVLGVVACSLPVLAISSVFGGAGAVETIQGAVVIVSVAVLSVSVALGFSIWARKAHEALMATYATWAVWLLALPLWSELPLGPVPTLVYVSNPFWVIFGGVWFPRLGAGPLGDAAAFAVGALTVSFGLIKLAITRIRAVTVRQASGPTTISARRRRPGSPYGPTRRRNARLDRDPAFWLETRQRQASSWGGMIGRLYAVISLVVTIFVAASSPMTVPGTGAFIVAVGLLMLSTTAAMSLAEERAQGSLDILLTTPLASRAIVRAKWWGSFRSVPKLAILPGILALAAARPDRHWLAAAFVVALVIAYGAAVTSVGLAMATWQPRVGRAVGLSVLAYFAACVLFPLGILMMFRGQPNIESWFAPSPGFGTFFALLSTRHYSAIPTETAFTKIQSWILSLLIVAYVLFELTALSFDRCVGRVHGHAKRIPAGRSHQKRELDRQSQVKRFARPN